MKISRSSSIIKPVYIYIPIIIFLVSIGIQNKIPISILVIDIFTIADMPAYTGFISNIGVLMWCFSCSVAFFSYSLMRSSLKDRSIVNFLLCSSLISLLMLFDDFFLLHERFFQTYFHIPEEVTFMTYIFIFLFYAIFFRKKIFKFGEIFLILTVFFLGVSTSLDFLENIFFPNPDLTPDVMRLSEEGSKLLGIFSWGAYIFNYCYMALKSYRISD